MKSKKIMIFSIIVVIVVIGILAYFTLIKKGTTTNIENNNNEEINPGKELVYDAEYMLEGYEDKSYISKTTEQKYSLKDINLPYINLDSEDAKEVNKTISYLYMEMAEIFKEELNGSQTWYNIAGYTVYQTSDFLSVVINTEYGGTSVPTTKYFTFNFDLTTLKQVTFKDYLNNKNINVEDVDIQVNNLIRNYDVLKNMDESLEKSELISNSIDNYNLSMKYDTLNYFVEEGKLNIILTIQVPTESGEVMEIFNIETSESELTFGKYKISEWENMIKYFYDTHGDYYPDKVVCHYIEQGDFVADIYTDGEITDQYIFDNKTFIAVNNYGTAIDFVQGILVESKVEFLDNQYLAIGYVLNEDYEKFKEKYLYVTDSLEEFDYRSWDIKDTEQGNRFVFIPKSDEVLVTVYDCFLNSNDEIELDNTLLYKHTGNFSILDDYIEVVPNLCIIFEYKGLEKQFYIQFNGENGHLYLEGVEKEVKDISLYND